MKLDKKRVSISSKRQITIPQTFFSRFGFETEAEFVVKGNDLILRPIKTSSDDFSVQILEDLVSQGLSGTELVDEFRKMQANVRPAVEAMLEDAQKAAAGIGDYTTYDDIFGVED